LPEKKDYQQRQWERRCDPPGWTEPQIDHDVQEKPPREVTILAIGIKGRHRIRIGGEEVEL
jgi:hypothetical protein